jgi:hypothetical protein
MTSPDIDVEAEIDRLYQLPLVQFTEERNALAARVKARGDKVVAARVKSLARPNVSTWVTNQIYWTARPEFEAFLASAQQIRDVQAGGAGGAALREAMQKRREAQAAVMRRAESCLASAGHGANPGTLRRVSETLQALAAESAGATDVRPGRLVHDLDPPGFEAFAGLAGALPPAAPPASRVPPEPTPLVSEARSGARALEEARNALAEAERRVERARREAREADGALSVAAKRAESARVELGQMHRRFERAQERVAGTAADESAARLEAGRLASARDAAEEAREAAVRALRALE